MKNPIQNDTPVRYKCHTCHVVLNESDLAPFPETAPVMDATLKQMKGRSLASPPVEVGKLPKGVCPNCGEVHLKLMCPLDHCHCSHAITTAISYCPECGEPMCPECQSHDVMQISRVTGYMQVVSGWNKAKQQELKDRTRYEVDASVH